MAAGRWSVIQTRPSTPIADVDGWLLMSVVRQRSLEHRAMAEGVVRVRSRLADQTWRHLAVETQQLTPTDSANLIALVDATSSPEAYEARSAAHRCTQRQISRTWIALGILLVGWAGPTNEEAAKVR